MISAAVKCSKISSCAASTLRKHGHSEKLIETLETWSGDLDGTSAELDDVWTAATGLRRAMIPVLAKDSWTDENVTMCKIMFRMAHVLPRYLGDPDLHHDHRVHERFKQRLQITQQSAHLLLKAVFHLVKLKHVHDSFSWESLDEVLQDCVLLARYLESARRDDRTSPDAQVNVVPHVEVSNAYWVYYMFRKPRTASSALLRTILQRCVEAVATRPLSERRQSFLSAKLEQLAISFERNEEKQRAAATYKDAVENCVQCGMLRGTDALLSSSSMEQLLMSKGLPANLVRCLKAHARVSSTFPESSANEEVDLDVEDLNPLERGLLLEVQLQELVDCPSSRTHQRHRQRKINRISATLVAAYEVAQYPLRRLRVICTVFRIHLDEPSMFESSFIQALKDDPTESLARDENLKPFAKQYKARALILFTIVHADFQKDKLLSAITAWSQELSGLCKMEDLLDQIDGVEQCVKELELAADYFDMKALEQERLATLNLLNTIGEIRSTVKPATYVLKASELATLHLRMGFSQRAGSVVRKAHQISGKQKISHEASLSLFIASAELYIDNGDIGKGQLYLSKARRALQALSMGDASDRSMKHNRFRLYWLASEYLQVLSLSIFRFGSLTNAVYLQRLCVNFTYTLWAAAKKQAVVGTQATDGKVREVDIGSHSSASSGPGSPAVKVANGNGWSAKSSARLWPLAPRLVHRLLRLSTFLSYTGLFLEAQYYLDEAFRICKVVNSANLLLSAQIVCANLQLVTGNIDHGISLLDQMKQPVHALTSALLPAEHSIAMAKACAMKKQDVSQFELLEAALDLIEQHRTHDFLEIMQNHDKTLLGITAKVAGLSIGSNNVQKPKRPTKGKTAVSRISKRMKDPPKEPDPYPDLQCEGKTSNSSLSRVSARIKRLQASNLSRRDMTEEASRILEATAKSTTIPSDAIAQANSQAENLIRQVLLEFSTNPVYSLLKDSTTSYPSVARRAVKALEKADAAVQKPRGRPPAKNSRMRTTKQETPAEKVQEATVTKDLLARCFESLTSILKTSQDSASISLLHRMADLLYKDAMMLSVARSGEETAAVSATFVAYALEMARSVATLRELSAIKTEELLPHEKEDLAALDFEAALAELPAPSMSPVQFQTEYINILPVSWCAISISLSDDRKELRLSAMRAGQPPFMLSIPLNRDTSPDSGEESFGFKECMSELSAFIDLANFSTHDAGNKAGTVSKEEWWDARSALDSRLRDLVHNVENIWLGGFRGLFAHQSPPKEMLSRFQRTFYNILDKHLPSRRRSGKGQKGQKKDPMVFDPRILEMFVGLGHPRETKEMENFLMDLLYFAVDILQFHGERNAYDEIDFDAITIEVIDALICYHEAVRKDSQPVPDRHTILILDKALHSFPWEALPCLAGQAVSRLPSLVALRSRIVFQQLQQQQQNESPASVSDDYVLDPSNGAYILNPAGDLVHTESVLGPALANLPPTWSAVVRRAPTEAEITTALSKKSLYLFFGHGSGAQYVRTRRIRRLERCAVALLMGCSSGTVTTAGSLESYGTPLNYLCGGAPAVVGTLWDVTDRDIDRFSVKCLERWGLFAEAGREEKERSRSPMEKSAAKGRGKGKAETQVGQEDGPSIRGVGLDRAVADARDACILKFLNGAAPVVYGIPVFLGSLA